jgi:translin
MKQLEEIAELIRHSFDERTAARDRALAQARTITRHCSVAIRSIHRDERESANNQLDQAKTLIDKQKDSLSSYPDLYFAGYTQSALKEYAEASIFFSLVYEQRLPSPEELGLEYSTYLQGLSEVVGEYRRRCLDKLRHGDSDAAEDILSQMDDIYAILITMDYPDAITGGLRRLTDIARAIIERTRGDLTMSLRQEQLEQSLLQFEEHIKNNDL